MPLAVATNPTRSQVRSNSPSCRSTDAERARTHSMRATRAHRAPNPIAGCVCRQLATACAIRASSEANSVSVPQRAKYAVSAASNATLNESSPPSPLEAGLVEAGVDTDGSPGELAGAATAAQEIGGFAA